MSSPDPVAAGRIAPRTRRDSVVVIVPLLVALLALHPLSAGDFVSWDDLDTVARNPRLNPATLAGFADHWTSQQGHLYVPVTYSAWHAIAMLTQGDRQDALGQTLQGWVFSTLNLLVHLVGVAVVALILLRLTQRRVPAIVGATLFAIHPLQIEAIGWISGLKDLLSTTLMLASVLVFLSMVAPADDAAPRRWRLALLYLLSAAAMLAKPTAMVLPAMLLVLDVLVLHRPARSSLRLVAPMLLLLSLPTAVVTRQVQQSGHVETLVPILQRPVVAIDSLAFYLRQLAWPISLTIDYGRTPRSVIEGGFQLAWLLPIALLLASLLVCRRLPWLLAALLLALLPLLPVLGFVPFDFQYISGVADHYAYPAMFGVSLLLAMLWQSLAEGEAPRCRDALGESRVLPKSGAAAYPESAGGMGWRGAFLSTRSVVAAIVVAAWLAVLAVLSHRQAYAWRDTPSLMNHAMQVRPSSWLAANNLASHLLDHLPPEDSLGLLPTLRDAERLARRAVALRENYAQAHNNLGYALYRQSRIADADAEKRRLLRDAAVAIRESLRIEPRDLPTLVNAAEISGYRAALDEAAGDLPAALKWLDASIDTFSKILAINPGHAYALRRLEQARSYRTVLVRRLPAGSP